MSIRIMGIHILCDPSEFSLNDIQKIYGMPTREKVEAKEKKLEENAKKNYPFYHELSEELRKNMINASLQGYFWKKHNHGWSIFDMNMTAKKIKIKTASLSKKINKLSPNTPKFVLYTTSFSSVDFSFSVYSQGEQIFTLERSPLSHSHEQNNPAKVSFISDILHIQPQDMSAFLSEKDPLVMCNMCCNLMSFFPYITVKYENGCWMEI